MRGIEEDRDYYRAECELLQSLLAQRDGASLCSCACACEGAAGPPAGRSASRSRARPKTRSASKCKVSAHLSL